MDYGDGMVIVKLYMVPFGFFVLFGIVGANMTEIRVSKDLLSVNKMRLVH